LFSKKSFVWTLASLCQFKSIPFSPELLLRRFPPPYDLAVLQQAAIELGLKVSIQAVRVQDIHPSAFPVLVLLKQAVSIGTNQSSAPDPEPDDSSENLTSEETSFAIVLKTDGARVLFLAEGSGTPQTQTLEEFQEISSGQVLFFSKEHEQEDDRDPAEKNVKKAPASSAKFGFRWFIPELLKHKKIWREILAASFAIQVVALATPLCTQVIIDKVVVHHTTSTLVVIAAALGIFLIFNAAMGWVRQYLILHTGNRMDAVLGHKVFSHLLHLPMGYFDHRPTGTLVARLHGVETIREFLAGSLVSLILDFPFLIVFLAIMFWYSWQLSLIAVASLAIIAILSLAVTPLLRKRLNHQFLLGARNQAFLTEYVSGMETVKSLQLEPQLQKRYGEYLGTYLSSTFSAKQLSNTYNTQPAH
jgi:subfamily B ATP-binding cassette protein HlyB/CyaB